MTMLRTILAAALVAGATPAAAETVKIAIGGASCVCYMPVVLAEQLGLYEKHGVDVELVDFKGGSAALKAVVGGSADVVSGYYEHTITLAAKRQELSSFVLMGRLPGIAVAVAPGKTDEVKSIKDLAGKTVGISAPGSSTDFFLKYMLSQAGLDPNAASVVGVGVGATAVAALEQGRIDAVVTPDPAITQLQSRHADLPILVDTRKAADTHALFGADYPGAALYTRTEWLDQHPEQAQALAAAIVETLEYIHNTPAEEIAAKMPPNLVGADKQVYIESLNNSMEMLSETGLVDAKGAEAVQTMLSFNLPEVAGATIDLGKTYTNAYVEKVSAQQ
ncbi:ABC transporter substrate-binding protein [Paracoccus denitrificans]|jgi:NitT/TauT family transport system substrate-binding protein|uniref:Substrate-binding region of ABC-type glycine betaine transport system n=1 Tax=Paracoccus denitrificans (strain Pd 1222) TaxID=318586 RepID=A1BBP7_PARDP|nr:ABC transporter substrate-binding protein [Paracoccus denitrificans]ABL72941.1 Substrate-binding region of ABC-type glycine betaine transport system [Paracoccus denitrificans PD1222]MBB4626420.1 NitT/TauT family transport system substrate-binding protein [Paracoccus denitrificans]MCU7427376.1 ABC transporter substrate-binding protein [Paracoccus denitrificans]QAR29343.1 transporter substrate-binding domain-containing protein [Paracoccus denitrificans]UPV98328.1 ABC transporter substrate-bin